MTATTRQTTALDRAALRRFHLGAPGAPAGGVPAGTLPAALRGEPPAFLSPDDRMAVLPGPEEPLRLLGQALVERQREPRAAFAREARELAARAEALLESERLKGAASRDPERLGSAMGALGSHLVDPSALAGVLGERRGAAPLGAARVRALEAALELLREAAAAAPPAPVLVHDPTLPELAALAAAGDGWSVLESADPCSLAADLFDERAAATARLLAAVRRVRLEAAGDYEPARHDALLGAGRQGPAGFDWQAFSRDELALIPPVVALESAGALAGGVASLSQLLLSGRPVQVLVVADPAGSPGGAARAPFAGFRFEPAYLGLAHREAFVQQGSAFRPRRLLAGFVRAAAGTRAALHVIDAAPAGVPGLAADLVAGAAVAGRAHPLFQYDPEAGPSFAERMDFAGNPAPAADWPGLDSEPERREDPDPEAVAGRFFTFADYALLAPALAGCFLPVPEGVADDDLVSVPEWLALPPEAALEKLPAVAAVAPSRDGGGAPCRLVVSRPLALACRDRLGFWRTLQELSGARSEYVRRAQERAREEAETRIEAERQRLQTAHAAELARVHREAVEQAVDRLTGALLGLDPAWLAPAFDDPLAAFAGRDAEGVAAELLEMVGKTDLREPSGDAQPASEAVDGLAAELLTLLDGNGRSGPAALEGTDR
jgi:hypothetical protein